MQVPLFMLVAAAACLVALWLAARGAITVCVAEVKNGRVEVTRGGIAPRLLVDLGDVVARPPVTRATIRITRSSGAAQVDLRGDLSAAQMQRIRNVIGSVPLAKLANARVKR